MSKQIFATTTITINLPDTTQEINDFVSVEELDSASDLHRLRVESHNLSNLEYTGYDCAVTNKNIVEVETVDLIAVTDGKAQLSHLPYSITDVTFAMKSSGFPDTSTLEYDTLVFDTKEGDVAIVQVTYTYQAEEIEVIYSKNTSISNALILATSDSFKPEYKTLLYIKCDTADTYQEITFVNELPDLSESHTIENSLAIFNVYSTSFSSLDSLKYTWTGGPFISNKYITEEVTETIEIKGGFGYTSKNILSISSYEFIEGYGNIKVSPEEIKNNRVEFTGTGNYSGIKEAVANITYQTKVRVYVFTLTEDSTFFKFEDMYDNSVSGTVDANLAELQDVEILVIDHETDSPVTNAGVEIAGKKTTTDTNGRAVFTNMPKGKYLVKITKTGYICNLDDNLVNEWIDV